MPKPKRHAPKDSAAESGPRPNRLVVGSLALLVGAAICYFAFTPDSNGQFFRRKKRGNQLTLKDIPFDGEAAMKWVERVCALGPRYSGSPGMQKQQEMLIAHFRELGGQVEMQEFVERHPQTGRPVPMANLIVRWHPDRKERILLCAHYDTRPFPDEDPVNTRGVFVGANDGGSGVGVLAELGRHMPDFKSKRLGVDFCLFDGEELVYGSGRDSIGTYFLGSKEFAMAYASDEAKNYKYRAAVLLDMVGDQFLDLYKERNGAINWRDSRWIVKTIWDKAAQLGVTEFYDRPWNTNILDDHIMLHDFGKIPACDIIDFKYRSRDNRTNYWHTTQDTPDKCSALSLAKVGWVVHEWLKDQGKR